MFRKMMIAVAVVAVVVGGTGYLYIDHSNDVARAKQVRVERARSAERAYQARVLKYRAELKTWQAASAEYTATKLLLEPVFDDLATLGGAMTADERVDATNVLRVDYEKADRDAPDSAHDVLNEARMAFNQHLDAANIMREWRNDFYDDRSIDDLPVQSHFDRAQEHADAAEAALSSMDPGPAPEKPVRGSTPTSGGQGVAS